MNAHPFNLGGVGLVARASGALWQGAERLLCVSDLHLGKSERIARRNGGLLPPYEVQATLERLEAEISATDPRIVVCLGDSFDDLGAAQSLGDDAPGWLARLQAGRRWIWIEGNHDPGPVDLGGSHLAQFGAGGLTYRHICTGLPSEISGHYHPKLALAGGGGSRPCFLIDAQKVILPAFGAYTGGLPASSETLQSLMGPNAIAVLTGKRALAVPLAAA